VTGGPDRTAVGYRPALDGLRAVAVYLVVLFHAGSDRFSGGFVGVDVFFVLSGYLVTQLLLRDLVAGGRIGFGRFYARRARRLLPASFATLLVTAAVYSAIATPGEIADALGGFRAAFLYWANWFFFRESTDYFAADVERNPVLHFWSLAVEEQFYVAWPLLLAGLWLVAGRWAARRWAVLRTIVAVGAVASLARALDLSSLDPDRAYYGTDTRAYQLLAGALLAMSPRLVSLGPRGRVLAQRLLPVVLAALVVSATSAVDLDPIQRGALVVALTCALLVAVENAPAGFVKGALTSNPVVYLGRISYGTYLWHWPVVVVALRAFEPSPLATTAIAALFATALASLSYQLLEMPVRQSRRLDLYRVPVVAVGVTAGVVAGLVVVPAVLDDDRGGGASLALGARTVAADQDPDDLGIEWDEVKEDKSPFPRCLDADPGECTIVRGGGRHVLVVGDSHARMLLPTFTEIARRESLTLSAAVLPVCPWMLGIDYVYYPKDVDNCRRHRADWYDRLVPALDPDVVVLVHRPMDDPADPTRIKTADGAEAMLGDGELPAALRDAARATVERLRDDGRKVVIVEPVPTSGTRFSPVDCLSGADTVNECRYVASDEPTPLERFYRGLSHGDGVWSLDIDRLVCPYLPICDPIVDGTVVKRDPGHLTNDYALVIADDVGTFLREDGIIG
jgi:peptidoglycan/LPS O-acetylase OafA/YrhL